MGTREDRTAEIREIQAELQRKVASLTTSDDWRHALDVAAKFHHYSLGNVLWLSMQAEQREMSLKRVAGFKSWQSLGRQVRKGERSLKVLAPVRIKSTDDDGNDRYVVRGFTVASVFDVSQTDGEPLPNTGPALLAGEGTEQPAFDRVVRLIAEQGFTYERVSPDRLHGANGVTDHDARTVQVRDDVSTVQAFKTTVHELAHVLMHAPSKVNYRANRPRCEVEAESVAYVALSYLGVSSDDYSLPYVGTWAGSDSTVVHDTAEAVIRTAHRVIEALAA